MRETSVPVVSEDMQIRIVAFKEHVRQLEFQMAMANPLAMWIYMIRQWLNRLKK